MRVFLLPEEAGRARRVEIRGEDFHYLSRVLRLKAGEEFRSTDGSGGHWLCRVARIGRNSLEAVVQERLESEPPGPQISLLQVLPKGRKMDLIVRQATESGVARVVPLVGRRSLCRFGNEEDVQGKLHRWRRIAREAMQQSGAPAMPVIEEPRGFGAAFGETQAGEVRVVFHQERCGGRSLHECLAGEVRSVLVVIGPEGGLADEELDFLVSRGFQPVTVGVTVLRTETAAVFAVAAIQTILQERQAWQPVP